MSRTVLAPPGFTLGDGTTATQVASARWTKWRWMIVVGVITLAGLIAMAVFGADTSTRDLSTNNHQPNGARAAAEVLRDQGVTVREVSTLRDAYLALSTGGTLVIADYVFLSDEQIDTIATHPGEIIWFAPLANEAQEIHPGFALISAPGEDSVPADCDAPAAVQATTLSGLTGAIAVAEPSPDVDVCFSSDGGESGTYVRVAREAQGDVHVLADASIGRNDSLTEDGNAALLFNVAGAHENLVWYVGEPFDETWFQADQPGASYVEPITPPYLAAATAMLVVVLLAAALWQGRRMGALVTEPLPVIVRASEATRGRARLYRRGQAHGHASAALRAGAAVRMAGRLGLPRSSTPEAVVAAIAAATKRDGAAVHTALYGPEPSSDTQMIDLTHQLDELEREVSQS